MNEIIHANPEQQKDILWKKYLSKKKSFAKARLAVDDFTRLDQPEFKKWVSAFAGDVQSETFLNQYYVERYDERISAFRDLCTITRKSASDILFQVQSECIRQNKFFWAVVVELYEQAEEEAEQEFQERLRKFMEAEDGTNADHKGLFDSFEKTCHGPRKKKAAPAAEQTAEAEPPAEPSMEIKKLYRTLCLRHHPDKTGFYNEPLWLEIQEAYEKGSLKKLQELMKRPVVKDENTSSGLTSEDIRNMITELEQQFKPVRAKLRQAKKSWAWDFHLWNDEKRRKAKSVISNRLSEQSAHMDELLKKRQSEVAEFFQPGRKHKRVQIIVERCPDTKTTYTIRLCYGSHQKELPLRRGSKMDDAEFAELCVVTALRALRSPCRVSFILPAELRPALPNTPPGFVHGSDYGNLLSRHIVSFDDMRDEYDFSEAKRLH